MASEWASKKASNIIGGSFVEHDELCGRPDPEGCDCGVEELEGKIAAALDEARAEGADERLMQERDNANGQWRYMVQEISVTTGVHCDSPADAVGVVRDLFAGAEAYKDRAEKAERERDKLAEGYERRRVELDAQYAEIQALAQKVVALQADLDAVRPTSTPSGRAEELAREEANRELSNRMRGPEEE